MNAVRQFGNGVFSMNGREWSLLVACLLAVIVFSVASPHYATSGNAATVLRNSVELLLIGLGMTLLLAMGGIDVSIGAPRRVTLRGGARASMSFHPEGRMLHAWSPYVDLRYAAARDAGAHLRAAGERLSAARAGRRVDVATGASFELGERWVAYADATASLGHGRNGETGRGMRLGAAWTF